jgi:hypothetical protein
LASRRTIVAEEKRLDLKGLSMRIRTDAKAGPAVPTPDQALAQIHAHLAAEQARWADQLARDPATFAQLEPQIHRAFGQLADRLVASLLAHAAQQPPLAEAAQKK